jgi:hypothetical protein
LADNKDSEYAKHLHKRRNRKTQSNGRAVEVCSLESAESHVRASAGASRTSNEGGEEFAIAFACLVEWAEKHGLIHPPSDFPFLERHPDGFGDEHEAWFDAISNLWFKATYPNRFGLAWGGSGDSATAKGYLARLVLQNHYFSDDIQLVALINADQRLRVLTSQSHIHGEAAPYEEIKAWFQNLGFVQVCANDRIAWYLIKDNLLIADAHEGNVIKTPEGDLVPIDLNICQPVGELFAWACDAASRVT